MADLHWYDGELLKEVEKAKKTGLRKAGRLVMNAAKRRCPVGIEEKFAASKGANKGRAWTGRVPGTLRASIRYRLTRKGGCQVIAGGRSSKSLSAFYAMWVEFGTRRSIARPFMRPALYECESKIEDCFKDTLK